MQAKPVGEHAARAPDRSLPVCIWVPERMHRALRSPHRGCRGLLDERQQASLLHQVCQEREHGRIDTEHFTKQDEAQ
jgi:hypothetical protein